MVQLDNESSLVYRKAGLYLPTLFERRVETQVPASILNRYWPAGSQPAGRVRGTLGLLGTTQQKNTLEPIWEMEKTAQDEKKADKDVAVDGDAILALTKERDKPCENTCKLVLRC